MEKTRYIQPQTYVVSCINTSALLAGSGGTKNITGDLPDGSHIDSGGNSSKDHYETSSGDAKKHNAWDSWDD